MNETLSKSHIVFLRCIVDGVIFIAALYGPWWLFVSFVIVSSFCFSWFVEGVIVSIIHDALYSVPYRHVMGIDALMTIGAVIFLFAGLFVRKRLRIKKGDSF